MRMQESASWEILGGKEYYSKKSDDDGFLVFAEDAAEGVGDFADGGVGFDGGEDGGEEIFSGGGAALEFGESGLGAGGIAPGAESVQAGDLGALDFGVDAENGNGARMVSFRGGDEIVYADYDLIFFLDGLLKFVSGFLDFSLDETGFDGTQHSSHTVDFGKIVCGQRFNLAGEGFDGVGAGDGVDGVGYTGFIGENLLGAQGDERGVFGGQGERFVHGIGVQGLAATENGGAGCNGNAHESSFRLWSGEGG